MKQAYELAKLAFAAGEIPVGAVVVNSKDGKIVGRAFNTTEKEQNATNHAELLAIRQACELLQTKYLIDCDLYVTLEPCSMCAAGISLARIRRLYFGAYDAKSGGVEHEPYIFAAQSTHHKPEVIGGLMEAECGDLMRSFFLNLRV